LTQTENSRFKEQFKLDYWYKDIKIKASRHSPKNKLDELMELETKQRIEFKKWQLGLTGSMSSLHHPRPKF